MSQHVEAVVRAADEALAEPAAKPDLRGVDGALAEVRGLKFEAELEAVERLLARVDRLRVRLEFGRSKVAVDRLLGPDRPAIWTAKAGHHGIDEVNETRPSPTLQEGYLFRTPAHERDRQALTLISGSDEPVRAPDLADQLGCSRPKAFHTLRRLEERGLIRKVGRGRYVAT